MYTNLGFEKNRFKAGENMIDRIIPTPAKAAIVLDGSPRISNDQREKDILS